MRVTRFVAGVALVLIPARGVYGQQQPKGVPARATPAEYAAQTTANGTTYAASLVPASEVKHLFAFDISKNYVVFEVAVYPQAGGQMTLDTDGFVVRSSPGSDPARPSDSVTVASVIQQKNLPPPPSKAGNITASTAVGYESGRDPYTGQRVHGTYTASEVSINNQGAGPPRLPGPGGYPQDRDLLENQLWDKSLPAGPVLQATAGYLYFPSSLLKKKATGTFQLEYLGAHGRPVLAGATRAPGIELQIPAKSR